MRLHIEFDTDIPADAAALKRLFGDAPESPVTVVQHTPAKAEAAPAKPATPKAPTKAAPKPPPAPEPVEEDLISGGVDLREQAVQKATELVTSGKSTAVREALAGLGAKRVSDLSDDQLEAFLAALG